MKKHWNKLKFFCWWYFVADDNDRAHWDMIVYGESFMDNNGKRIDPRDVFK